MSSNNDYFKQTDPDGDVLWYWYEQYFEDSEASQNTKRIMQNSIKRLEKFLAAQNRDFDIHWTDLDYDEITDNDLIRPRDLGPELTEEFLAEVREHYAPDTQQNTFGTLQQAYDWCERRTEPVEENVFEVVKQKADDENRTLIEQPTGRNPYIIPLSEARNVVQSWDHPMWVTVQLFFGKYPRRAGAVSNLDYADLSIDHPGCNWETHTALRHWDDHLVIREDKRKSGDGRNTGNKTTTTALYPLDEEMKDAFLWYLSTRPEPNDPTDPIFVHQRVGSRLSGYTICNTFISKAKDLGYFYEPHDDDNLNPHYWRHWGTTWYEDKFSGDSNTVSAGGYSAMTKYMRGDKPSDIAGLYDSYSPQKRDKILDSMPKFLDPYIDNARVS